MNASTMTAALSNPHQIEMLEEEIATLEARLKTMGLDGDCAYERALSQVYTTLVEKRREQLAAMRAAGF